MRLSYIATALMSAALLAGCKEEPKPAPVAGPSTVTTPPDATTPSTMVIPATMPSVIATMPSLTTMPMTLPSIPAPVLTPPVVPSTPVTPAATVPATAPSVDAGSTDGEAKKLYSKAMTSVKELKFDDAKAALTKLEGLKSGLSPEWQAKIDKLKGLIDTGEKANISIPGLGK